MRRIAAVATVLAALLAMATAVGASARSIGGIVPDLAGGPRIAAAAVWAPRYGVRAHAAALNYEGGPVLHSNRTHVVFWEPGRSGLAFDPGYETLIERFLGNVAADSHLPTNVYSLSGQYTDAQGPAAYASSYAGALVDRDPLPPSGCVEPASGPAGWSDCITDAQVQQELEHVVSTGRLPAGAPDMYFMVLPDGLGSCTDGSSDECALGGSVSGYCGYHSETQDNILYAVIPYNAVAGHCQSDNPRPNGSSADPAISTISHEHNETVTDPETYNSWIDSAGNEDGDLCITNFGPALGGRGGSAWNEVIAGSRYWLQEEWSNEDGGCRPRDEADPVTLSVPARAPAGRRVSVGVRANDPDGRIVAYSWSFGDGGGSRHRLSSHAFARAGGYRVALRITDSAGLWSFAARSIRVLPAAARERSNTRRTTTKHALRTG